MLFRVLGPLAVEPDTGPLVLTGSRSRALLTVLLLAPGKLVPVHRLAEALWESTAPADIDAAVHSAVARLRRALGPVGVLVVTRPPGYLLDIDRGSVDAEVFEMRHRAGAALLSQNPTDALATLDEALALWRGPAYGEFADGFARSAATHLEQLRVIAREDRAEALLRAGAPAEAAASAVDIAAEHPLRERPVDVAMRALTAARRTPEALATYQLHCDHLREELGLDPSRALRDLHARILRSELDPVDTAVPHASPSAKTQPVPARPRLPARPSPLVGRREALASLGTTLTARRLVTLVGTGGVGKTRTALELAYRAVQHGRAVWWVDLVPVTASRLIDAVATATGVEVGGTEPVDDLCHGLAGHRGLLVLDNAEHLLKPLAALVERLLGTATGLTLLVTSRERLALDEEAVRALPPFEVPADADLSNPALLLFVERAGLSIEMLGPAEIELVAHACRRLDGVPLAIELGAARAGALGLPLLLDRLGGRLDLLGGGRRTADRRHRTLRAVVEWSHELLTPEEARLFIRLAVFPGKFTMDQAEAVCADDQLPPTVIAALLARLVEQSLVHRTDAWFALLETLRAYAAEHLARSGEEEVLRARHAYATADRLTAEVARLWTAHEPAAVRALTELSDDLHAAWRHATEHDRRLAVRLAADVHDFAYGRQRLDLLRWGLTVARWDIDADALRDENLPRAMATAATAAWSSGRLADAAAYAELGVRRAGGSGSPGAVPALRVLAHLAMFMGRTDEAASRYRQIAATSRADGQLTRALVFEFSAAQALGYGGRTAEATTVVDGLLDAAVASGNPSTASWAHLVTGLVVELTDPDRALACYAAAVDHGRSADCRLFVALARSSAAALIAQLGAAHDALPAFSDVLDLWAQLGNELLQWWALARLVALLSALGADRDAAVLAGAVLAAAGQRTQMPGETERLTAALRALRTRLGAAATDSAVAAGAVLGQAAAVAHARRAIESAGTLKPRTDL
jgi:predicted ATPase/DNA-binding SARP family transcriptional activator